MSLGSCHVPSGLSKKATSLRVALEDLAEENEVHRGRLLGLATAAIIENRELFPDVDYASMSEKMAEVYEKKSAAWSILDTGYLFDSLGRLDPQGGDPRLRSDRWIEFKIWGSFIEHHSKQVRSDSDILLASGLSRFRNLEYLGRHLISSQMKSGETCRVQTLMRSFQTT